jgi:hypothetical protein
LVTSQDIYQQMNEFQLAAVALQESQLRHIIQKVTLKQNLADITVLHLGIKIGM